MRRRAWCLAVPLMVPLMVPLIVLPPTGVAGAAVPPEVRSASLTVPRVHHVDVDGDGSLDRVALRLGRDLRVRGSMGTGHYRVVVRLASGPLLTRRLRAAFYYDPGTGPWTPWHGATQVDHVRGQELVLGRTSGAHTTVYTVLTLRGDRLRVLDPPGALSVTGPGWVVNASVGTGMQGWLCTPRGVRSRSAVPVHGGTRYWVVRRSYVLHLVWHLTRTRRGSVSADPSGAPPPRLGSFAQFRCPGLPR